MSTGLNESSLSVSGIRSRWRIGFVLVAALLGVLSVHSLQAATLDRSSAALPWSFAPVGKPTPPAVRQADWPSNPVDSFILASLERDGMVPGPKASKLALIRRATFDLIGLPPTPEEVTAFENDSSPQAFAKVVDRLLSSSHYGERWGRHWLDVVRYADTAGDTADYPVGLAWRYRNYVIDSFNHDKPYDVFVREQIAGDVLAKQGARDRYAEQVTATGFLAISRRFGFDSENYHHLTLQDTLDTLGQTVLGLSLGCARCHDHKFDPISMRDYYGLYGIFASSRYAFPGSEQKAKMRSMVPLLPAAESQPIWRDYDLKVASLATRITREKQSAPSATFRSLDDSDGDFETQKDAAGGSYGVIVPPWRAEGKLSVSTAAQSPFKNLYPSGRFGASIAGGEHDYLLAQTLHPSGSGATNLLYLNLDFRPGTPEPTANASHRFWIGSSPNRPLLELMISSAAIATRNASGVETLAELQSHQWHNLQLTVDLAHHRFSGRLTWSNGSKDLEERSLALSDSGPVSHVQLDAVLRQKGSLPPLEIDNFGVQTWPLRPATMSPPTLPLQPGQPDVEAIDSELARLVGHDGDLEWQKEGSAPSKPWNPGPNSQAKISRNAQSPFATIFPQGSFGISMPSRAEYDGVGLSLPTPWSASRSEQLYVSFDFKCGDSPKSGEGSWRYYVGHGAGNAAAVELSFDSASVRTSATNGATTVASLKAGDWYQVQLALNLKTKSYTGRIANQTSSYSFGGALSGKWDGSIDYTFVDSYGDHPGVRSAVALDNFEFAVSPPPLVSAPAKSSTDEERASRQARVVELRAKRAALTAETEQRVKELSALLSDGPCEMAYGVVEGTFHNERVQLRGEPDRPGEETPRGFIKSLGGDSLPAQFEGSGRLELSRWLTSPSHPLTARVMMNRIWLHHFGRGLVPTPNDFGRRGQLPSHPELLDYLATYFMEHGWSMKTMHRLLMLSSAYQVSALAGEPEPPKPKGGLVKAATSIPDYRFFPRRRLTAEEIRDSILAVSGDLDPEPAQGHPFPKPVNFGYTQHGPFSAVYDHNQRSIYLMSQRLKRHPFLALFDGPDPNASTPERRTTTVPTQALYFLNSPFVHEKADHFAKRLLGSHANDSDRLVAAWQITTGRNPNPDELSEAKDFVVAYASELRAAGQIEPEQGALSAYLRSLFGSNEFLHLD